MRTALPSPTVSFSGRAFGVFVVGGPDAGKLAYEVDGKRKGVVNLYRHFSKKSSLSIQCHARA